MLRLSYILDGAGWAAATVGQDDRELVMTVSYLHDSLGELAQTAIDLCDGRAEASVVFMSEPGEHLMRIQRQPDADADELRIEIRWFRDWASWGMYPSEQFQIVFEARCPLDEFVRAVAGVLDDVLNEWGIEGYREKWIEHAFPTELHRALAGRLGR